MPLVLAAVDDPAPSVQRYGHAALHHVARHARCSDLDWQKLLLLDVAKRLVVGCEEGLWQSAMPAATALVKVNLPFWTMDTLSSCGCNHQLIC